MELLGAETVSGTEDFVMSVGTQTGAAKVSWVSTRPAVLEGALAWRERATRGEQVLQATAVLAQLIGSIGLQKAARGNVLDALSLDANYVRRPYVEVSWKGTPTAAGK